MPVDNRKTPASFQNCGNTAREVQLIGNAMERVRNENKINRPLHKVGNGISIPFNQIAISRADGGDLCFRKCQHSTIDIDRDHMPRC